MIYRRILYIFLLALPALALHSCSKQESLQVNNMPEAIVAETQTINNYLRSTGRISAFYTHSTGVVFRVIDPGNKKDTIHFNQIPVVTFTRRIMGDDRIIEASPLPTSFDNRKLKDHIPGWQIGLQLITKGGKIELYIPSGLAFGNVGVPGTIPPNSILHCELSLIDIK